MEFMLRSEKYPPGVPASNPVPKELTRLDRCGVVVPWKFQPFSATNCWSLLKTGTFITVW